MNYIQNGASVGIIHFKEPDFFFPLWALILHTLSFCITEEMDWDRNGMVSVKEFLFAFTRWIGIDEIDDEDGIV